MKWAHLLFILLPFLSICAQNIYAQSTPSGPVDEIISYNNVASKTEFIFYQHDGTSLAREGDATYLNQFTGWLTGDTDEALNIVSYLPLNISLKPDEGKNLTFSIEAEQSDGASVSYSWELDGNTTATSKEWTYIPDLEVSGRHTVVGSATDGKLTVQKEWTVDIEEFNKTPSDSLGQPSEDQPETIIIDNSPPEIELISPTSGDVNGVQKVVWKVSDKLDRTVSVILSVSGDGEKTWDKLASGEGDGSFSWDTSEFSNGEYILKITAENTAGKSEQTIELTLENLEEGTIYISSSPTGADIIIGGKDFGETNKEVEIPAGYHAIQIKKEGHAPWAEWVEVKEGQNPDINVRLIPMIFGLTPVQLMIYAISGIFLLVVVFLLVRIKG
jgi:hypothetical protein